jgi:hypothetical protein
VPSLTRESRFECHQTRIKPADYRTAAVMLAAPSHILLGSEAHLLGAVSLALNTLVGPIKSRHALTAPGLASMSAYSGPLVMNSTSCGKKALPSCSA